MKLKTAIIALAGVALVSAPAMALTTSTMVGHAAVGEAIQLDKFNVPGQILDGVEANVRFSGVGHKYIDIQIVNGPDVFQFEGGTIVALGLAKAFSVVPVMVSLLYNGELSSTGFEIGPEEPGGGPPPIIVYYTGTVYFQIDWSASFHASNDYPGALDDFVGAGQIGTLAEMFYSDDPVDVLPWDLQYVYDSHAVPEPASWALMIAGFGLVGAKLRRRRDQAKGGDIAAAAPSSLAI